MSSETSDPQHTPLPLIYDPGPDGTVAIKAKYKQSLAQARLYEQFGSRVLRLKAKTQAALGKDVEELGVKRIGHGKILMASDFAEEAIARISLVIMQLQQRDPPCDPDILVDLMQLQRDFNKQLLETGQAHIDAEKMVPAQIDNSINLRTFPAGTPMVVAITKGKEPGKTIEDTKPPA